MRVEVQVSTFRAELAHWIDRVRRPARVGPTARGASRVHARGSVSKLIGEQRR
jgi:hypothetical protein